MRMEGVFGGVVAPRPHLGNYGGASARLAHTWHLFGPLLIQSRNPRFLHGPFPVGDKGDPPFHKFFVLYRGFFLLASYAFWMWHI